jgi:hypothetical protein
MGRIYFAGEALEPNGEYGYVHGAALTGQSVAQQIVESKTSTSVASGRCVLGALSIVFTFIASVEWI